MGALDVYERTFDEEGGKQIGADDCEECGGELRAEGGEIACTSCGLVVDGYDGERIDHGPEWRSFDDRESNPVRTGAALTPARHDRGLSSEIGWKRDAKGNLLSSGKRRQLHRLRTHHARARWSSTSEQNLAHACAEIARIASALDLPRSVREEASAIYRRAQRADLIRGRAIETMAAGSVYAACRCSGHGRTLGEVAAVARGDESKVKLGYRVLNAELDLDAAIVRPRELVPRLASACGVSDEVRHRAVKLTKLAEDEGLANGRKPSGVAAACLYTAGQELEESLTQEELATHADVTPVTIRSRHFELRSELGE